MSKNSRSKTLKSGKAETLKLLTRLCRIVGLNFARARAWSGVSRLSPVLGGVPGVRPRALFSNVSVAPMSPGVALGVAPGFGGESRQRGSVALQVLACMSALLLTWAWILLGVLLFAGCESTGARSLRFDYEGAGLEYHWSRGAAESRRGEVDADIARILREINAGRLPGPKSDGGGAPSLPGGGK